MPGNLTGVEMSPACISGMVAYGIALGVTALSVIAATFGVSVVYCRASRRRGQVWQVALPVLGRMGWLLLALAALMLAIIILGHADL